MYQRNVFRPINMENIVTGHPISVNAKCLSLEEIRARRLAVLEGTKLVPSQSVNNTQEGAKLIDTLNYENSRGVKRQSSEFVDQDIYCNDETTISEYFVVQKNPLTKEYIESLDSFFWDPKLTKLDKLRWIDQGILTHTMKEIHYGKRLKTQHDSWGLLQSQGGPCGLLACVQAEMIRILGIYEDIDQVISLEDTYNALAGAIGNILARAALSPSVKDSNMDMCSLHNVCVSLILSNETVTNITITHNLRLRRDEGVSWLSSIIQNCLLKVNISNTAGFSEGDGILNHRSIKVFQKANGVMHLIYSLLATRTIERIKEDMDDPSSHLTARFGYSSQELINLLLTGQATSNTFDKTMILEGGLCCFGIQEQPMIGYLTELEALRYCSVGNYYKSPKFPIWLIGSTSHFTVLFGSKVSLEESDTVFEKCRQAFRSVSESEEDGFIKVSELHNSLKILNIDLGEGTQTLAASLEMDGSGIILWSDFLKKVSRLCSGAMLDSVLQDKEPFHNQIEKPILLTQYGEGVKNEIESDETMARRLALEWGSLSNEISLKSDEDFAIKLQAEFDSTNKKSSNDVDSVGAVASHSEDIEILDEDHDIKSGNSYDMPKSFDESINPRDVATQKVENDVHNKSFQMYHYNSMNDGTLTKFKVLRVETEEQVGLPMSLYTDVGGSRGDLEAVLRTKFPGCKIIWGIAESYPSLH